MTMGDTITVVLVIVLVAGIMFIFPVMTTADRADDVAQLVAETATAEFVDSVTITRKLTLEEYSKFVEKIHSTGNVYDIEMEIKVLDENPGKKASQVPTEKIGENVYFSEYTSQILDKLEGSGESAVYPLKEGDIFYVAVKNKNPTLYQILSVVKNDAPIIVTSKAGVVK